MTGPALLLLLMSLHNYVTMTSVDASRELQLESLIKDYTGYGVADAWAGFIWNRFPAEVYPLFLSPLVAAGRIKEAQERSRVWNLTGGEGVESYSGYITVNKTYRSNMFFWFFPAQTNKTKAPVLLWLNGGPGRTSLVGALLENGPFEVASNGKELRRRNVSWTQYFSVLYVDNPVGVGYSFTTEKAGMSKNMNDVSENLYSLLVQFFTMFPEYSSNDFYVGGQSYAGKYVPSLGCYLHEKNTDPQTPVSHRVNFKGIYLGAGYCDPENMMPVFPDFLYHAGLISSKYRQQLRDKIDSIFNESRSGKAARRTTEYLFEFFTKPVFTIGIDSADNLLGKNATNDRLMRGLSIFMKSPAARLKLHVGYAQSERNLIWSKRAANALNADLLANTSKENAFLMDNYKVLHYSGNLDIVVNVPMTEAFLQHVQWAGQEEYRESHRYKWFVDGELAGWYTTVRNVTRVIVRNCGHMVPFDQPKWALDMMKRFIFDQPFGIDVGGISASWGN